MHFSYENVKILKNTLFELDKFNNSNDRKLWKRWKGLRNKNFDSVVIFCQKKLTTAKLRELQIGKYVLSPSPRYPLKKKKPLFPSCNWIFFYFFLQNHGIRG